MLFIELIQYITSSLLLLFTIVLLTKKRRNIVSNRFLALFLFVNSLLLINSILLRNNIYFLLWENLNGILGIIARFSFGPALYFYSKTFIDKSYKVRPIHILNIVPSFIFLLIHLLSFKVDVRVEYYIFQAHVAAYLACILKDIKRYRKNIKEFYSNVSKQNISWLMVIVSAFMFMWFLDFMNGLLSSTIPGNVVFMLRVLSNLINFTFANYLFLKAIESPNILVFDEPDKKNNKYEWSNLTVEESEKIKGMLISLFEKEKPFLNPDLNINHLSTKLGVPGKHISQVINQKFQKNFHDYVNHYRIQEAQNLLMNSTFKNVLEVAFSSGFNSKSAFNSQFKKHTNLTPTQFKRTTSLLFK